MRTGVLRWIRGIRSSDAGFTLVEVVVSTVIIGVVMTSLMMFFSGSIAATGRQFGTQVAAQLADDALEKVRALRGSAINDGRDKASVLAAWNAPATGVARYLADSTPAWDPAAAAGSGATAVLPTTAVASSTQPSSAGYYQYWYIGSCWQASSGGDCSADSTRPVPFYRVVAAVTWQSKECASTCSYVTSTLISATRSDPVFNPNGSAKAPVVNNPNSIAGGVGVAVDRTITASGGAPPITWSAARLPTGLTMASDGRITGTPTTAASYSVLVSATDGFGLVGTATFTWTIATPPTLTSTNQTAQRLSSVNCTIARSGGTGPFTFGATGSPSGTRFDNTSGTFTGTLNAAGVNTVTVTVTDSLGQKGSTTFTWTVT